MAESLSKLDVTGLLRQWRRRGVADDRLVRAEQRVQHLPASRLVGKALIGKRTHVSGGNLMAVDVTISAPLEVGTPHKLFEFKGSAFSPSQDGQRFLAAVPQPVREPPPSVNVVLNWATPLGK